MDIHDFRILYDYDSWANHRILEACAPLTAEQFARDLGSSFRSVRDTLVHILGAEWVWLERWQGHVPEGLPVAADFPDLESVRRRWAEVERDLRNFVHAQTAETLERIIQFQTRAGFSINQPLRQCLQHVANHSTYHRGQVTAMLRQLGAKPVSTDLIGYYREQAAKASA